MEQILKLADYGVVATLLGLSLTANVFLYKVVEKKQETIDSLKDKMIEKAEKVRDEIGETMKENNTVLGSILSTLQALVKK